LLYCLLDALVDQLFPVLEAISDRLEELEDIILTSSRRDLLKEFHSTKRELSLLRRTAWPLRELIHNLHREHHECLSETTRTYLRDVYDHVVQVLDLVETYRDVVESLTEAYMTSTANRLNDIMKTLTVISTIFVPLTFLAGVYGMNIPIPESHSPWMYPLFWLVCLSSASGMIFWFRSRGWF
ncbi:MAG: magnesium/cobalt transporter CorA, partial [Planctomycetota bacterium]